MSCTSVFCDLTALPLLDGKDVAVACDSISRRKCPALHLLAVAAVIAAALFWPAPAGAQSASRADVAARDQLIANQ